MPNAIIETRMDGAFFSEKLIALLDELGGEYTISVPFERYTTIKGHVQERKCWRRVCDDIQFFEKQLSLFNPGIFHNIDFYSCGSTANCNAKNRYSSICLSPMILIINTSLSSPTRPLALSILSNTIKGDGHKRGYLHNSNHKHHLITCPANAGMPISCSSYAIPWHTISMPSCTCATIQGCAIQLANDQRFGFSSKWGLYENKLYNGLAD